MRGDEDVPDAPRLVEVGWVIDSSMEQAHREALALARARVLELARQSFPGFEWRMPVVDLGAPLRRGPEEPVKLLEEGLREREGRGWDFVLVVTRADLRSYYRPFALATPCRALGVAGLSLARLTQPDEPLADREVRAARTARRLVPLCLHLLGDLNGLAHSEDPTRFTFEPSEPADLDRMVAFSEREIREMTEELRQVADVRLEELPEASRPSALVFYLRAAWLEKRVIGSALLQAKPWEFPFRLPRLTMSGVAALMVLLLTAEAWELGTTRSGLLTCALSAAAVIGTSFFVLKRQGLLLHRSRIRLREQVVSTNFSIFLIILLGMVSTYALLFLVVLLSGLLLFDPDLVQGWAASLSESVGLREYLTMAGMAATLGLVIGALGASFEGQYYFRHITIVDEET